MLRRSLAGAVLNGGLSFGAIFHNGVPMLCTKSLSMPPPYSLPATMSQCCTVSIHEVV